MSHETNLQRTKALACTLALALVACQSSAPEFGRMPASVIELYDLAAPDGVIEIELERDGSLREIEADIRLEDLPNEIAAVALREVPGGRMTGAERELRRDGSAWEVKLVQGGRNWELVVDESGRVLETEKELAQGEAPAVVRNAALAAIPGGEFATIELIERPGELEYHVKLERGGGRYKVVLDPEGGVLRRVREARAEIEIPLAD